MELDNQKSGVPILALWENFFRQVIFAECRPFVEEATKFYRKHATEAELEDVKQEALLQLWKSIEQNITVPRDFETKARRAVSCHIKRVSRFSKKQTGTAHQLSFLNAPVQLPSDELEHQEMLSLMSQAFQNLGPAEAQTLKRRHGLDGFKKKTVAEIADSEQVSRQAIRKRENEALRKLRQDKNIQSLVS